MKVLYIASAAVSFAAAAVFFVLGTEGQINLLYFVGFVASGSGFCSAAWHVKRRPWPHPVAAAYKRRRQIDNLALAAIRKKLGLPR